MSTEKLSAKEILKRNKARTVSRGMNQVIILLDNLRSMHNVGAAFRCADAFGIHKILLSGVTPAPPRPEITKTAIGAEEYVKWEQIKDTQEAIKQLHKNNYLIAGIEQTESSILLPNYAAPNDNKMCLIFGNEVTGIDEEILPLIDTFIEIPQYGNKHSLNVSVSVGVALYAFLEKYGQS